MAAMMNSHPGFRLFFFFFKMLWTHPVQNRVTRLEKKIEIDEGVKI